MIASRLFRASIRFWVVATSPGHCYSLGSNRIPTVVKAVPASCSLTSSFGKNSQPSSSLLAWLKGFVYLKIWLGRCPSSWANSEILSFWACRCLFQDKIMFLLRGRAVNSSPAWQNLWNSSFDSTDKSLYQSRTWFTSWWVFWYCWEDMALLRSVTFSLASLSNSWVDQFFRTTLEGDSSSTWWDINILLGSIESLLRDNSNELTNVKIGRKTN